MFGLLMQLQLCVYLRTLSITDHVTYLWDIRCSNAGRWKKKFAIMMIFPDSRKLLSFTCAQTRYPSGNGASYITHSHLNSRRHMLTVKCLTLREELVWQHHVHILPSMLSCPPASCLTHRCTAFYSPFSIRTQVLGPWPNFHANRCMSLTYYRAVTLASSYAFSGDYMNTGVVSGRRMNGFNFLYFFMAKSVAM